jgi:hypothetical protein
MIAVTARPNLPFGHPKPNAPDAPVLQAPQKSRPAVKIASSYSVRTSECRKEETVSSAQMRFMYIAAQ